MSKKYFFSFLITLSLLVFQIKDSEAAGLRKMVLAVCTTALLITGCEHSNEKYARLRKDAVVRIESKLGKSDEPEINSLTALKYFALSAYLVKEHPNFDLENLETIPSEQLFDGISFELNGKTVHWAEFFESLTSLEKVAFEEELKQLGVYFGHRFKTYLPKRIKVGYSTGGSYFSDHALAPISVVFSKGGLSGIRACTESEVFEAIKRKYPFAQATASWKTESPVPRVSLDVSDLPVGFNRAGSEPWRQWLSKARYPGEF